MCAWRGRVRTKRRVHHPFHAIPLHLGVGAYFDSLICRELKLDLRNGSGGVKALRARPGT
jgi:hypothetical protein